MTPTPTILEQARAWQSKPVSRGTGCGGCGCLLFVVLFLLLPVWAHIDRLERQVDDLKSEQQKQVWDRLMAR